MEQQDRMAFIENRRKGVGGSDIARIMGESQYGGPFDVWLEKTQPPGGDAAISEPMEIGIDIEEAIARRFARKFNVTIERSVPLVHPDNEIVLGNLDAIVKNDNGEVVGVLEVKNVGARMGHKWGKPGTAEIPTEYLLQVQWYLGIAAAVYGDQVKYGYVSALIGGNSNPVYVVERDAEMFQYMLDIAVDFWSRYVVANTQPTPTHSDKVARFLATIPREGDVHADPNGQLDSYVKEYAKRLRELHLAEAEANDAEVKMIHAMGGFETVVGDSYKITYKEQAGRATIDHASVKEELATIVKASVVDAIYERNTKRGNPYRTLRKSGLLFAKEDK